MENEVQTAEDFLPAGHVRLPAKRAQLFCVAASGVAFTIFDARRRIGGMGHYLRPYRQQGFSTPLYAAPAIVALARMFLDTGSSPTDLEAQIYGGAVNPNVPRYTPGLSEDNVRVGIDLFGMLDIPVIGRDVGGSRARKIVFQTHTGESVVAKVDRVRESDWYPSIRELYKNNNGNGV
jgi:chemotaxis protein CheD